MKSTRNRSRLADQGTKEMPPKLFFSLRGHNYAGTNRYADYAVSTIWTRVW
ncbi:MAG: hypothetical protein ACLU4P_13035 [Ruminococcus sp.]